MRCLIRVTPSSGAAGKIIHHATSREFAGIEIKTGVSNSAQQMRAELTEKEAGIAPSTRPSCPLGLIRRGSHSASGGMEAVRG